MSSLLDSLSGHLDDQSLRRISGTLSADQGATSKALAAAVPLLLAGLARNAAQPGGAQQLHDALAEAQLGVDVGQRTSVEPDYSPIRNAESADRAQHALGLLQSQS